MIVFIVPLIAPAYCKNWPLISALCERTLRSLTSQTSEHFHVILVCDEAPISDFRHPKLSIVQEPFWLPDPTNFGSRLWNKREKLKRGLIEARKFNPDFIMYADADDCVSSQLCAFIESSPVTDSFIIRNGYAYFEGSRWLHRRPEFDQICATSSVLRCREGDLPRSMDDKAEDFHLLRMGHNEVSAEMKIKGTVADIAFPAAVYVVGHGENMVGMVPQGLVRKFKRLVASVIRTQPLTSQLRQEFGIYDLVLPKEKA
jgi:hypothetical protein